MSGKLRIVLVVENPQRAGTLRDALVACGYDVVARLCECDDLHARLVELAADVIIVEMASPAGGLLEAMRRCWPMGKTSTSPFDWQRHPTDNGSPATNG